MPANSIGGAMSTTAVVNSTDNNLFSDINLTDALTGKNYYRCIYLLAGAYSYTQLKTWLSSLTPSPGTKTYFGKGAAGVDGTEELVSDEFTAPSGIVFQHPTSESGGLSLPDMTSGQWHGLWIKLQCSAETEGASGDYFRLSIGGVET